MPGSVLEAVRAGGVIVRSDRVLALVSGGRDSVCLLDVLVEICGADAVRVLHLDYGLRGEESERTRGTSASCARAWTWRARSSVRRRRRTAETSRPGLATCAMRARPRSPAAR